MRFDWDPAKDRVNRAKHGLSFEEADKDLTRALRQSDRQRLIAGDFQSGADVAALRAFVGLTQRAFALALGISVHTLRNWEQDRRRPEGPALALLRIAARHPKVLRENLRAPRMLVTPRRSSPSTAW